MGDRRKVPRAARCRTEVKVIGVLQKQPIARSLPGNRGLFCECVLEVGRCDYPIRAEGKDAELLAETPAGYAIEVLGTLKQEAWTTKERKARIKIVVDALVVTVVAQPDDVPTFEEP